MAIANNLIFDIEVVVKGTAVAAGGNQTPSINTFTFLRQNSAPVFAKAGVSVAFQASILAAMKLAANIRYTPNIVSVRILNDYLDQPVDFVAAGAGAIATDSLPSRVAAYVLMKTGIRGGSYRGGKHFGPASEADTTGDIFTGAGLANWQAVAAAILLGFTDANGSVWLSSVLSRKLSSLTALPLALVVANPVTSATLQPRVGQMKRRKA